MKQEYKEGEMRAVENAVRDKRHRASREQRKGKKRHTERKGVIDVQIENNE